MLLVQDGGDPRCIDIVQTKKKAKRVQSGIQSKQAADNQIKSFVAEGHFDLPIIKHEAVEKSESIAPESSINELSQGNLFYSQIYSAANLLFIKVCCSRLMTKNHSTQMQVTRSS